MQGLGLVFSSPHRADEVHGADVVVYSSAIREDNVARAEARAQGIACIRRAECLAAILHTRQGVIISGTHGKTTTSAMCAHVLRRGGMMPCHYVGAEIPVLGSNAHWQEDCEVMVAEGDESDGTLELYHPQHTVILNIEEEHLDYYRDIEHIKEVFAKLLDQTAGKKIYFSGCPVRRSYARAVKELFPTAGKVPTIPPVKFMRQAPWCPLTLREKGSIWVEWNWVFPENTMCSTRWRPL